MGGSGRRPLRPKPPGAVQVGRVWLDAFLDYSAGECHLAENTVAAYGRDLRRFVAWLQGRAVVSLTIRDLADYTAWLHAQGLSPATLARHLVSLKVFFRYLQLEGVLQENLAELLAAEGVTVDGIFVCPHGPDDGCDCRKPRPGLIHQAATRLGFEPRAAVVVGDKMVDVELAHAVGAPGLLVTTGHGPEHVAKARGVAEAVVADLGEAAAWIERAVAADHGWSR